VDKLEMVEIVNRAYAAHNQTLLRSTIQDVQRVWFDLLGEFDATVVYDTFLELTTYSVYMPTPGNIRRAIIEKQGDKIPSGLAAWGTLQQLAKNAHSGIYEEIPVHEVIRLTVADIGNQAYELHTNGDRELFIATYERVCELHLRERLRLQ
jgi:hypothetical protein